MLQRSKDKLKSISVGIAVKLGLLDAEKARAADELLAETPESPTLVLLVQKGYLDEKAAEKVRAARQKSEPLDELNESVKKAHAAISRMVPGR